MKIRSFRRMGKELTATGKAVSKAQAETKRLARELKLTQKPTQKLRAEFNRSKARTSQLSKTFREQKRQLRDLKGELNEAGISVQELGRHEKRLAAQADKARRSQQRLGEAAKRTQTRQRMAGVGRSLLGWGASYLSLSGMKAGAQKIGNLQERFVYLGIQADIDDAELKKLKDKIYSISHDQKIKINASELTSAVEVITEKSGDLDLARQNLKNMGLAIRATGASGADIGAMVNNLKEKFGVSAPAQIRAALETLVVQGKAGSFTLKDLAQQGERVTAAYAAMGRTGPEAVREMGALLQVFRKGAGSSEQATTAFEAVMRDLVKKAPQLRKELPGFEIWDPEKSRWENGVEKRVAKPVNQILLELLKRTGGDIEILQKYFGEESARGLKVLITEFQKNKGKIPILKEFMAVKGDSGQLEKDSQRAAGTINADLAVTGSKVEKALSDKGEGLVSSVTGQISKLDTENVGNALNWALGGALGLGSLWAGKKAFNLARGAFGGKGGGPGRGGGGSPAKPGLWHRLLGSAAPGTPLPVRVTNWPGGVDDFGSGSDGPDGPERGKEKKGRVKRRSRLRSGLRKTRGRLGRATGIAREFLSRTGGKLKAKAPFSVSKRGASKAGMVKRSPAVKLKPNTADSLKPRAAKSSLIKEPVAVKPKPSPAASLKPGAAKSSLIKEPVAVKPRPSPAASLKPEAAKSSLVKEPAAAKPKPGPAASLKSEAAKSSLVKEPVAAKPKPGPAASLETGAVKNSLAPKSAASKLVPKPGFWGSLVSGVGRKLSKAADFATSAVSKAVAKIGGKSLLKKVPVLSVVAGSVFATQRALAGDWVGAAAEMGSGLASTLIPTGVGQAISLGLDAGLVARDANLFSVSQQPGTQRKVKPEGSSKVESASSKPQETGKATAAAARPALKTVSAARSAVQETTRQTAKNNEPSQAKAAENRVPGLPGPVKPGSPQDRPASGPAPPPLISLNPPRPPDRLQEIHLHVDQRTNLPAGSMHDELMRLLTSNNAELSQIFKQILEETVRRERGVSFGYGSY